MAEKFRIKLNYPRLVRENKKVLRKATTAAADQLASEIQKRVPDDVPVTVTDSEGAIGQPVKLVTVAHASGLARQAKHGDITAAAASLGLDLHRPGD